MVSSEKKPGLGEILREAIGPLTVAGVAVILYVLNRLETSTFPPGIIFAPLLMVIALMASRWSAIISFVVACAATLPLLNYFFSPAPSLLGMRFGINVAAMAGVVIVGQFFKWRYQQALAKPRQAEHELFEAIMSSMHDAIVETDWKGIRSVNDSFCRMTGFSREELIGRNAPFPFWPVEEYAAIAAAMESSMRGKRLDFELVLSRKSGERFPVLLSVSRILDGNKTAARIVYSFRDITELKQAQEKIVEYQQRISLLVKYTPLAVIFWNLQGEVVSWNPGAEKLFGYTPEQAAGKSWRILVPPELIDSISTTWMQIIQQTGGQRSDNENVRADGRRVYVEWYNTALVDASGKVVGAASMCQDVTERRSAERLVAAQGRVLERIVLGAEIDEVLLLLVAMVEDFLPGSMCSVLMVNADGRTLHVATAPNLPAEYNQAVEGFPIGPNRGSCGTAVFTRQRVLVSDIDTDPRWTDGKELAARFGLKACHSEPILARDGSPLGTFAVYFKEKRGLSPWEMTGMEAASRLSAVAIERRKEEDALRRSELLLRRFVDSNIIGITVSDAYRILDANEVFLNMVKYTKEELNQGELLRSQLTPAEHLPADLNAQEEMAARGACSPFEKEYVRKDGTRVPVLVGAAAIEVNPLRWIAFVVDLSKEKQVAAELREAKERAEIANRTKDRFLNLLSHELRSPLTPIMTLASVLRNDERLPAETRADMETISRNAEKEARLIDNLLELVRLAKGPLSPDLDFTLGNIREAMRAQDAAASAQVAVPESTAPREPLHILLVEDHADTAYVLARVLMRRGHEVVRAATCKEALEHFASFRFDLLISDIGLPDGSGVELVTSIQAIRKVPAIALSGFGTDEDIRRSLEAGFAEHLVKPVNFETLNATIARYTQG